MWSRTVIALLYISPYNFINFSFNYLLGMEFGEYILNTSYYFIVCEAFKYNVVFSFLIYWQLLLLFWVHLKHNISCSSPLYLLFVNLCFKCISYKQYSVFLVSNILEGTRSEKLLMHCEIHSLWLLYIWLLWNELKDNEYQFLSQFYDIIVP